MTRKVKFTLRIVIQTKKWSIIILHTFKQLISIGNQVSGVISWGLQKQEGHFISAAFSNISQLPQRQSPTLKTTEEVNKYYEDSSDKI